MAFWLCCIGIFLRAVYIVDDEYPRTTTHSLGEDLLHIVFGLAFFVWLGSILWGWL